MGDPLQRSGASTPDGVSWDAVDEEISSRAKLSEAPLELVEEEEEDEHRLGDGAGDSDGYGESSLATHDALARRRILMLACACLLSVGSHYSSYVLGPIKRSLGTSESGFAALISSFELLNTISPLVSGFLVPKYGAAVCGLVATGAVLLGQLVVCFAEGRDGGAAGNIPGMVFGLLIFGAGTSPLAVVQETIILQNISASSRFVARSVAAGLVLGKTGSFAAGFTSERLYSISPRLPFLTATSLALFSFSACVMYAILERSTHKHAPSSMKADLHSHHRSLRLSALAGFGMPFWYYIAVCALAGTWYTTQHLSSHILQAVYGISESHASATASLILATPIFLYPLIGYAVDKRPHLLERIWLAVPCLTASSYLILLLLAPIVPPSLALLPAALGIGCGPLLLVLVVPRIVERHQAPTALGAHKSLEMSGAIIFQTFAGALLTLGHRRGEVPEDEQDEDASGALTLLAVGALVQVAVVAKWWHAIRQRTSESAAGAGAASAARLSLDGVASEMEDSGDEARRGLLSDASPVSRAHFDSLDAEDGTEEMSWKKGQDLAWGRRALFLAGGTVVFSWLCFVGNLLM
ncbi:hypothetical protein NBRC10512_004794 [Rhodotorula toruloides]|uniref:Lysosomal dipeptide transporter MFSD1 n=2 Tax=Rhodotorula toruloides TaxID=5286 RepID=A0A061AKR7_RHOTO|nr:major facilitator superfamily protein [Rhodotorula toruloides NP11]EMS25805.1 major facilitator superfamily protein [Rhodotorula toruloides NP11]CDR38143.1 RHTO0S03e04500g1_1 [Rhodotorula toruloides]